MKKSVLIVCPKCGHRINGRLWRCPGCGGHGHGNNQIGMIKKSHQGLRSRLFSALTRK